MSPLKNLKNIKFSILSISQNTKKDNTSKKYCHFVFYKVFALLFAITWNNTTIATSPTPTKSVVSPG